MVVGRERFIDCRMPPARSTPPKRYRPGALALRDIRPYRPIKSPPVLSTSSILPPEAKPSHRRRKWSGGSRVGRFLRRHGDGRLATHACEAALLHIVSAFAMHVSKVAVQLRGPTGAAAVSSDAAHAESLSATGAEGRLPSTEEGHVRKALALLRARIPTEA